MRNILLALMAVVIFGCNQENEPKEFDYVGVTPVTMVSESDLAPNSVYPDWEFYVPSNFSVCNVGSTLDKVNIELSFMIDRPKNGKINGFNVNYDQADSLLLFTVNKSGSGGDTIASLDRYDFDFQYTGISASDVHFFGFQYSGDDGRKKVVSADPDNYPFICD